MNQGLPSFRSLFAAFVLGCATFNAAALQLVTEENPPFNFTRDGSLTGMSVEIATVIGQRAKVPMTFASMPWDKAYATAQSKADACVFSTARLENRERIFKWVGPIAANEWALFAKTEFTGSLSKLADAKPYRIGAVDQDAKIDWLKDRAITNIVTFAEDKLIPPRLTLDLKQNGGVDLWVTGLYAAKQIADSAKTPVKLVLKINRIDLFIACNPGVSHTTITAMTDALAAMKKDGSFTKITKSYEERLTR